MKMIIYCDDPAEKLHYCAVHGFHGKHGTDNCPSLLKLVEEIEQGLHCNSQGKVDFGPPVRGEGTVSTIGIGDALHEMFRNDH